MISYGTPGSSVFSIIHISKFDPSSITATKHFSDSIILADTVSRVGSEWVRSLSDSLALVQSISDFYVESKSDTLSLASVAVGVVDRPASGSNSMSLLDSFIYTGTITTPDAVFAIFDTAADKGMALYIPSTGHVDLAQADAAATAGVVGLALQDVLIGVSGPYITEGQITKSDWTSVIGAVTLTAGLFYFLDKNTAGHLTATPVQATGEYVVRVGRALTSTTLDIEIAQPVLL